MILIPKYKDLVLSVKAQRPYLRGRYRIETMGADGRRRVRADWFPNLITTFGANDLATNFVLGWCSVGSGNATPVLGDTTLQTLVGSTSGQVGNSAASQPSAPYFSTRTITFSFAAGVATGNLAEVGIGRSPSGINLFSRALILDSFGSPTTITVLSSESLYVTYQVSLYVPSADVTGTVVISGTSYNYTVRGAGATGSPWQWNGNAPSNFSGFQVYNGSIGAVTGVPSGGSSGATSQTVNAYSSGSFQLTGSAFFDLTVANIGGISALYWNNGSGFGGYQVGLSAPIPKDGSHTLTLDVSWAWAINTP